MIKEAIEKIIELAAIENKVGIMGFGDEGARKYTIGLPLIPVREPICDTLEIHTLGGLVAWDEREDYFIEVADETTVFAKGPIFGPFKQRETYVAARAFPREKFPFGRFIGLEDFIIQLQSKFVPTEGQKNLIDVVSRVTGELVVTAEDDGSAQTVTLKDKMSRKNDKTISPIWGLAPYRTFSEVEQPVSAFLLRFEKQTGGLPQAALFEADGGAWRDDAILNISQYLRDRLPKEIVIIA